MADDSRPERLTAFEFIPVSDVPQLVRVKRLDDVVLEFNVWHWIGVSFAAVPIDFASQEELTIEGQGIGRPYWNDDAPAWTTGFDSAAEQQRIETIRRAAFEHAQRGSILLM